MAMIRCEECGQEISDQAKVCPHCGYPIGIIDSKVRIKKGLKRKLLPVILAIVLLVICVFAAIYMRQASDKKLNDIIIDSLTTDN